MREIRTSGSEGGGIETNRRSLPLSRLSYGTSASKTWMAGTSPAMTAEKWFDMTRTCSIAEIAGWALPALGHLVAPLLTPP